MKQQKSLSGNSAKKRKILLGTLIPLAIVGVTLGTVLPLTLCKPSPDLEPQDEYRLHIRNLDELKNFSFGSSKLTGEDYTAAPYTNSRTDIDMLKSISSQIDGSVIEKMCLLSEFLWKDTETNYVNSWSDWVTDNFTAADLIVDFDFESGTGNNLAIINNLYMKFIFTVIYSGSIRSYDITLTQIQQNVPLQSIDNTPPYSSFSKGTNLFFQVTSNCFHTLIELNGTTIANFDTNKFVAIAADNYSIFDDCKFPL